MIVVVIAVGVMSVIHISVEHIVMILDVEQRLVSHPVMIVRYHLVLMAL